MRGIPSGRLAGHGDYYHFVADSLTCIGTGELVRALAHEPQGAVEKLGGIKPLQ
jgi:hypothetical protein